MDEKTVKALPKSRKPWHLVETTDQLSIAIDALRTHSGWFGIDAERASGFRYSQRAYLIQICRGDSDIYLIDPASLSPKLDKTAFSGLAKLLRQDTWILHAATQDLGCLAELGLTPIALIDTELGSRIAGLPRVGLGAVVEHYLGLSLAKEHSAVDWSTRPLQQSWLEYAALDVDVLHELAQKLLEDLEKQGKSTFANEEFAHLLNFKPKAEKSDKWRGVSGLHEVKDQRGLAIARALWQARETLAIKLDVAPGRLVPDSSISHVAKKQTATRPELANDRQFTGRASRSYLDTWWEAVEVGRNTRDLPPLRIASTGIPNHKIWSSKFPEAHKRLISTKSYILQMSDELSIPQENLLTPDYLRQLCWQELDDNDADNVSRFLTQLGARRWQCELLSAGLSAAIRNAPNFELPTAKNED
ncbi:MAG: HRDC domain-containing protein [Micrococcales bacterium]